MEEHQPGVIDLSKLKDRAVERSEEAEKRRQEAMVARAAEWDAAMARAFKGILPSPERHAFLRRSLNAD